MFQTNPNLDVHIFFSLDKFCETYSFIYSFIFTYFFIIHVIIWYNEWYFSKIQLVVYYQCCVLIGWATTKLYVIDPSSEKRRLFAAKKDWRLALTS